MTNKNLTDIKVVGDCMNDFSEWLTRNTALADSSIYKYSHATKTISNDMERSRVISKPLEAMTPMELDVAILHILSNDAFVQKNKKGNSMYSNALKQFRAYRKDERPVAEEETTENLVFTGSISETEKTEIIRARIGQGVFRRGGLGRYNHRCIISGIDMPRLLIASHIKPWATSSNNERLQPDNGLCLSPA